MSNQASSQGHSNRRSQPKRQRQKTPDWEEESHIRRMNPRWGHDDRFDVEEPAPHRKKVEVDVDELNRQKSLEKKRVEVVHNVLMANGPLTMDEIFHVLAKDYRKEAISVAFKDFKKEDGKSKADLEARIQEELQEQNPFANASREEMESFVRNRRFLFELEGEAYRNTGYGFREGMIKIVRFLKESKGEMGFSTLFKWICDGPLTSYAENHSESFSAANWTDKWFSLKRITPESVKEIVDDHPELFVLIEDRVKLNPAADEILSLKDYDMLPAYQTQKYRDKSREFTFKTRILNIRSNYMQAVITSGLFEGLTIYVHSTNLGFRKFANINPRERNVTIKAHFTLGFSTAFNGTSVHPFPSPPTRSGQNVPVNRSRIAPEPAYFAEKRRVDSLDSFLEGELQADQLPFENMGSIREFVRIRPHLYNNDADGSIYCASQEDREAMFTILENIPDRGINKSEFLKVTQMKGSDMNNAEKRKGYLYKMVDTIIRGPDCSLWKSVDVS